MALFGRGNRDPAPPPRAAALPVPPFAPDPPALVGAVRFPSTGDPVAALAAQGVTLDGPVETFQAAPDLPVWSVPVSDDHTATDLWTAVREVHPKVGLWPVLATAETWERTAAGMGEIPDSVTPLDASVWFTERAEINLPEMPRGPAGQFPDDGLDWDDLVAAYPDDVDRLLLVPASAGWAVPGLLGWSGAVNPDILGDIHTAVLRRWSSRWGADLVVVGPDTLTLKVGSPPSTPADALGLAVEMTLYCADTVHQGVGTVDALVPMAASSAWWFWWD